MGTNPDLTLGMTRMFEWKNGGLSPLLLLGGPEPLLLGETVTAWVCSFSFLSVEDFVNEGEYLYLKEGVAVEILEISTWVCVEVSFVSAKHFFWFTEFLFLSRSLMILRILNGRSNCRSSSSSVEISSATSLIWVSKLKTKLNHEISTHLKLYYLMNSFRRSVRVLLLTLQAYFSSFGPRDLSSAIPEHSDINFSRVSA